MVRGEQTANLEIIINGFYFNLIKINQIYCKIRH